MDNLFLVNLQSIPQWLFWAWLATQIIKKERCPEVHFLSGQEECFYSVLLVLAPILYLKNFSNELFNFFVHWIFDNKLLSLFHHSPHTHNYPCHCHSNVGFFVNLRWRWTIISILCCFVVLILNLFCTWHLYILLTPNIFNTPCSSSLMPKNDI